LLLKLLKEDVAWQNLLRNKYLNNKTLAQAVHKPGDSQFWAGLMDIKDPFFTREKFIVFFAKREKNLQYEVEVKPGFGRIFG